MKKGDLVRYNYPGGSAKLTRPFEILMVLAINNAGGTLKCISSSGEVINTVRSYCDVINEKR